MYRKTTATHSKKFHLFVINFKTNKYETQTQENFLLQFIYDKKFKHTCFTIAFS